MLIVKQLRYHNQSDNRAIYRTGILGEPIPHITRANLAGRSSDSSGQNFVHVHEASKHTPTTVFAKEVEYAAQHRHDQHFRH